MTYRAQPPGPTQQDAAPALREVVMWFVGRVRESRRRSQESARAAAGSMSMGCFSVLQHRLVALEHTLGDLWSSALQRDLRGEESRAEYDLTSKRVG